MAMDLTALGDLLSKSEDAAAPPTTKPSTAGVTPASFGSKPKPKAPSAKPKAPKDPKAIWDIDEVPDKLEVEVDDDPRERPEFDILYKQDVTSEDVYLGMGEMTPSSSSCNMMVVKIKLPGEKQKDVELDVVKQKLLAQSPKYKLSIYLPHPVNDKEGKALWDPKKSTLTVTLPIIKKDFFERVLSEEKARMMEEAKEAAST